MVVYRADYRDVYRANGLDAYFFVRFLRFMAILLLPIWLITWAVLLPITSVNSIIPGNKGLDLFSYGNVQPDLSQRYAAHVIIAVAITGKAPKVSSSGLNLKLNAASCSLGMLQYQIGNGSFCGQASGAPH
jgi:hypothetical protein